MGLDTPETCRGWWNILRISCGSSWFFFTPNEKDVGSVYSFMWGSVPEFAWRCEVNHENSWCSLFTGRDLNLGSPECEAGIIHNGLRLSFSREVGETGYSGALQLGAYTVYVSERTVSRVQWSASFMGLYSVCQWTDSEQGTVERLIFGPIQCM
jgi:hypothetical protein